MTENKLTISSMKTAAVLRRKGKAVVADTHYGSLLREALDPNGLRLGISTGAFSFDLVMALQKAHERGETEFFIEYEAGEFGFEPELKEKEATS